MQDHVTKALTAEEKKKPAAVAAAAAAPTASASKPALAAAASGGASKSGGAKRGFRKSVTEMTALVRVNDPDMQVVDFSGQASVQMKSDEKISELCDAIGESSPVTTLLLKDCNIGPVGAAALGSMLADNTSITTIDLSANKALGEEGAVALAEGLANNTAVTELNLMGLLGAAVKSELVCSAFIKMYETNLSLKKIIWRLDHPLAHQLARLATRNNSIARRISQDKPFADLLPDALKDQAVTVHGAPADGKKM